MQIDKLNEIQEITNSFASREILQDFLFYNKIHQRFHHYYRALIDHTDIGSIHIDSAISELLFIISISFDQCILSRFSLRLIIQISSFVDVAILHRHAFDLR